MAHFLLEIDLHRIVPGLGLENSRQQQTANVWINERAGNDSRWEGWLAHPGAGNQRAGKSQPAEVSVGKHVLRVSVWKGLWIPLDPA